VLVLWIAFQLSSLTAPWFWRKYWVKDIVEAEGSPSFVMKVTVGYDPGPVPS
jgi:hypothetical protein